jgi:hypothetical protein
LYFIECHAYPGLFRDKQNGESDILTSSSFSFSEIVFRLCQVIYMYYST